MTLSASPEFLARKISSMPGVRPVFNEALVLASALLQILPVTLAKSLYLSLSLLPIHKMGIIALLKLIWNCEDEFLLLALPLPRLFCLHDCQLE